MKKIAILTARPDLYKILLEISHTASTVGFIVININAMGISENALCGVELSGVYADASTVSHPKIDYFLQFAYFRMR